MKNLLKICSMHVSLFALVIATMFISGCGHTTVRIDRGTGGVLRIPLPNGDSLVELKGGDIDSTTIIMRGGTQVTTGRSVGGSLMGGSGGSANDMQISTIPQLNEGYMKDVMISPDVPAEVKIKLAEYMTKAKPNAPQPYKTSVVGASAGGGDDLENVKPTAVGLDNLVNKVAEVVPEVTEDASKMVDSTANATSSSIHDFMSTGKVWIVTIVAAIVALACIGLFIFVLIRKKKLKKKIEEETENIVSQEP